MFKIKRVIIPAFAAIAAVALAFGTSAFKKGKATPNGNNEKKNFATVYFRFDLPDGSESAYKSDNYTYMGTSIPGTTGCSSGSTDFCIVNADEATLGITALDDAQEREDKFVTYLNSLSGANAATNYLNSHWNTKKP